jgi:hypothetical protein
VAEALNRVAFYYARLTWQHAASYNQRPLAPGQLALLYRLGKDFDLPTADGTSVSPWPSVLADYKVLVNGVPAPIMIVPAAGGESRAVSFLANWAKETRADKGTYEQIRQKMSAKFEQANLLTVAAASCCSIMAVRSSVGMAPAGLRSRTAHCARRSIRTSPKRRT